MLVLDRVAAFPVLALCRGDFDAHFLAKRPRKESAHRVRLPAGGFHQFLGGRAAGSLQQVDNLGGFAAVAGGIGLVRGLTRFGRFLGGGRLLPRLFLLRRNVGATCANRGAFGGFRLGRIGRFRLFCDARHGFSLRGGYRVDDIDHSVRARLQGDSANVWAVLRRCQMREMRVDEGTRSEIRAQEGRSIIALLSHKSIDDAARAIGVNPNTLLRWLELPEFRSAYLKARREGVHQAVARLQNATGAAAITVLKLMTDPNAPAAVRLRAAECVFDRAFKAIEIEDIEARVSELESAAAEAQPGRPGRVR